MNNSTNTEQINEAQAPAYKSEVENLPGFELMMGMMCHYIGHLDQTYGFLREEGRQALRFNEHGKARVASIMGYITAIYDLGQYEVAYKLLRDYGEQLDYLAEYGGTREIMLPGEIRALKIPNYLVLLGDDGCRHSHTVTWHHYVGTEKPQDYRPEENTYLVQSYGWHKFYYRRSMNGGLIYHGPKSNGFSVTLSSRLWSVHT